MFGDMGKVRQAVQAAKNPAESEQIRALAGAFAMVEREQRATLREHADALGADPGDLGLPPARDREERITELCAAVGARYAGDPWETWTEHVAPDGLDADAAEAFAGAGADEWAAERERIITEWRENRDLDTTDYTDRDVLAADVRSRFGVPVDKFEDFVIDYSPGRVFEELLAGEFEAHTEAIEALTEEVLG